MEELELLVAILPNKSGLAILQEEGWYRIPVDRAPRRWPPPRLAFSPTLPTILLH